MLKFYYRLVHSEHFGSMDLGIFAVHPALPKTHVPFFAMQMNIQHERSLTFGLDERCAICWTNQSLFRRFVSCRELEFGYRANIRALSAKVFHKDHYLGILLPITDKDSLREAVLEMYRHNGGARGGRDISLELYELALEQLGPFLPLPLRSSSPQLFL